MFCEGTRFTEKKHKESMVVAREKGLPELKHHLLPRTKGFSLLAKGAPGRSNYLIIFCICTIYLLPRFNRYALCNSKHKTLKPTIEI
jgi:hypothetical protein